MCVYVCVFIHLKTKVGNSGLNGTEHSSGCKNPNESQCYVGHKFYIFNFLISYILRKFSKFPFLLLVSYMCLYS